MLTSDSGGFFENDSAALTGTSNSVLFKLASAMGLHPNMRLAIVGHTDSVGDFNYNVGLSMRRAEAVRNALLGEPYNVAPDRLVAMGAGSINPVFSNISDEGRALNRRVEFVILDETVEAVPEEEVAMPAQSTSKYAADVPKSVMTPDIVSTYSLGNLDFFDGMPSAATVKRLYDNLDLIRATTAFLDGIPVAAIQGFVNGFRGTGLEVNQVTMTETLMDARSLWLTANTTTIYVASIVDSSNGPVVIEVPPGILALMDDAEFTYVADFGPLGPDKGEGGKYLLLPPEHEGDIPDGYHVIRSKTYYNWFLGRMSPDENGDTTAAVKSVKDHMNIYPLVEADNPPAEVFMNLSGVKHNTVHANNIEFFYEVNEAVQREPAEAFNPELLGKFAAIGIKKGVPFDPDARMIRILTEAAAIANGTARAITYAGRDPQVYFYDNRQWNSPFQRQSHQFLENGARVLDDRTYFHYMATGITPAMTSPPVGSGSVYAMTARDNNGDYMDGAKTYRVDLPGPVPAKNFWSFMMYSGQTRSMLETDLRSAGIDSKKEGIKANDDGGFSIYVGPEAPEGWENNWVQTIPGKSFNMMIRLYGPLEPWFDKSWRPGDFVLVE